MSNEYAQAFLVIPSSAVSGTEKSSRRSTATSVQNHQNHCSARRNQTNIRLISSSRTMILMVLNEFGPASERGARGPALPETLFCARFRSPQNRLIGWRLGQSGAILWTLARALLELANRSFDLLVKQNNQTERFSLNGYRSFDLLVKQIIKLNEFR